MGTWSIATTAQQDEAITYSFQQAQKAPAVPGAPTPPATVTAFFQTQVENATINPMTFRHQSAKEQNLSVSLASVPPENRDKAQADIEAAIVANGGTVVTTKLVYQWSANTAAPPRNLSCELDQPETKWDPTNLKKITFHYLDAGNVDRMANLLAIAVNTLIRLEDQANAANFVTVITTAAPVQRQGANGYVEIAIRFNSKGGSFAALDTRPLTCTFN